MALKRRYTEVSDFKCDQCEQCFASKQRLQSHQKSPNACSKLKVPEHLSCKCGESWSEKTATNLKCWRDHVRIYEKRGFCFGYIHCRKCNHNIKFECKDRHSHVCSDCQALDVKMKANTHHPILTKPFDAQSYEVVFGSAYNRKPQIKREANCILITDDKYRCFEYFSPTIVGNHDCKDNATLNTFKKNAVKFCAHSVIWSAIKRHVSHCSMTKYTEYTSGSPMLKQSSDCLYWLYLSPQSYMIREFKKLADASDTSANVTNLQHLSVAEYYAKSPLEYKSDILRLTSDDKWLPSESYQQLKAFFGIPRKSILTSDSDQLIIQTYTKKLKNMKVVLPLATRLFDSQATVIDDILSYTGPVRTVSLTSRWEHDRNISHERQAENVFYFMMKFVVKSRGNCGSSNLNQFFQQISQ